MISLDFNICLSGSCNTITFTETTGAFSSTNIYGWGSPNEATSSAQTAVLEITDPTGVVTSINLFINSPAFPSSSNTNEYIITPSSIGSTEEKFSDGVYYFKYTVTRTSATAYSYSQVVQKLFYCNAKCCVESLFADIDDFECDCNAVKLELAYKADKLLTGLKYMSKCGQVNDFNELLDVISDLCDETGNCSSCD